MQARVRELVAYAEACGFTLTGKDGGGHYTLTHPNGATMRIPSTPGDFRGDKNARAKMRRLSGVTPKRPNSGRHRKGIRLPGFDPATERVESISARWERLAKQHRELCERITWLQEVDDQDGCREAISDLLAVEENIESMGKRIPLRTFRTWP